jgi:hypothetical protein
MMNGELAPSNQGIVTMKNNMSPLVIRPGFGAKTLHLGLSQQEVRESLGKPSSVTRKYEGQYFFNYANLGIEVDFGQKDGHITYIFFFRKGVSGHQQTAMVKTAEGILLGDSKEKVLEALGPPDGESPAVELSSGGTVAAWFRYDIGLNFQFSSDDLVDMITVSYARGNYSLASPPTLM